MNSSSDTESDTSEDVTNMQLAVADGALEGEDERNPLVSRIGGRIAWLPTSKIPPDSIARCTSCKLAMPLLVQIFAPLDDSPYDRILLVWTCSRASCQSLEKRCIKAARVLSYNARWAAKLEKKRQRREAKTLPKAKEVEEIAKKKALEEQNRKVNPFASTNATDSIGGLGASLFGNLNVASNSNKMEDEDKTKSIDNESESESDEEGQDELEEEEALKASIIESQSQWQDSDWTKDSPAYEPAQYLSTFAEPLKSTKEKAKSSKAELLKLKQQGGVTSLQGWEKELYENMAVKDVDSVFERFVERTSYHSKQLVRYEFDGIPLPFHAKGKTYSRLWPKKTNNSNGNATIVTGGAFASNSSSNDRSFNPNEIPPCSRCGAKRIFEMQLMPNLINTLRPNMIKDKNESIKNDSNGKINDEVQRRKDIEQVLGRKLPTQSKSNGVTQEKPIDNIQSEKFVDIRWNIALIFVCKENCIDKDNQRQSWNEEIVFIQSEDE